MRKRIFNNCLDNISANKNLANRDFDGDSTAIYQYLDKNMILKEATSIYALFLPMVSSDFLNEEVIPFLDYEFISDLLDREMAISVILEYKYDNILSSILVEKVISYIENNDDPKILENLKRGFNKLQDLDTQEKLLKEYPSLKLFVL